MSRAREGGLEPWGNETEVRTFGRSEVHRLGLSEVRLDGRMDGNSPLCSIGDRPI